MGLTKLDLSFNSLNELPPQISSLEELATLKLRSNRLRHLEPALFSCCQLRQLDVGQNQLVELSEAVGDFPLLVELSAPENKLQSLPRSLERCRALQVLHLYDNQLTALPELQLPALLQLNVGKNRLHSLPASIAASRSLEVLVCCRNGLSQLPDLSQLSALKLVDAMENRLVELPILPGEGAGAGARSALSIVNLGFNALTEVPVQLLVSHPKLAELHFQNNRLGALALGLSALPELKLLDISNNELSEVPHDLGYMEALQSLVIEGNPIRSIRRALVSRSDANTTSDLKKFLRSRGDEPGASGAGGAARGTGGTGGDAGGGCGSDVDALDFRIRDIAEGGVLALTKLPGLEEAGRLLPFVVERVFASHTLEVLAVIDLSGCQLEAVPVAFRDINTLRELVLASNKLAAGLQAGRCQPDFIPPSLRLLDVSRNGLTAEHAEVLLMHAHRVQCLRIGRNCLTASPRVLEQLQGLRELDLSFNQISNLDLDFHSVPAVEVLDISNNKIDWLGDSLANSRCLRVVNLSNNNLTEVPFGFGFVESLQSLQLQGCPIRALRQAVINGPCEQLKQALRNKAPVAQGASGW